MLPKICLLAALAVLSSSVAGAALSVRSDSTRDANTALFAFCERVYADADGDYVTIQGKGWGSEPNNSSAISDHTKKQIDGCGLNWSWKSWGSGTQAFDNSHGANKDIGFHADWQIRFKMDHRAAFNCEGRAVYESGGPDMTCQSGANMNCDRCNEIGEDEGDW